MRILKQIEENSLKFLFELYERCKDDESKEYNIYEIGRKLKYNEKETEHAVGELHKADLVRHEKDSDKVSITLKGTKIVRRIIWKKKGESTEEYPWICSIG
ncbi:MAG TPA: hypothetical protein VLB01_07515 [Thermodesulfobacteriota bacterium]|nr:hypothetical protein [Thermodesulfobacteriota bacterium]